MKKSTKKILSYFPMLEKHINDSESAVLRDKILTELDNPQRIFLCLAWFFESPDREDFNLNSIYKELEGDWLSLALECIFTFFTEDTYLIKEPTFSVVTEKSDYFTQADFVKYLNKTKSIHGKNFSRPMLNTYLKRGDIPAPDLVIGGRNFWKRDTCEHYVGILQEDNKDKFIIVGEELHEVVSVDEDSYFLFLNTGSPHRVFEYLKGILSNLELHKVVHYRLGKRYHTIFHVGNEQILFNDGFASGYGGSGPTNLVNSILLGISNPSEGDRKELESVIFPNYGDYYKITVDIL